MRVARWKVMAGGLLLSAGGLMAVADGPTPCPPPVLTLPPCLPPPATVVRASFLEPPVAVPPPRVDTLPPPPPAVPPKPAKVPAVGHKLADGQVVMPPPPAPRAVDVGRPVPLPAARPPLPAPPAAVPVGDITFTPPGNKPAPPLAKQLADNMSPPPVSTDAVPPPAMIPVAAPAPAVPAERPPAAAEPKKAPEAAEKRLKVVLHMGDDRPRFEVRDGDEVYLKVVSDRVEVKSAADKGDAATMKAAGKVGFVTPGGDGTCDELAILPGSGQVVAVGNVSFRHTWGRSETTVTAERMTFRLNHAGPTSIQAGYTPGR